MSRRKRTIIGVFTAIGAAGLCGVGWFLYQAIQIPTDAYAVWWTADLVIEHMERNGGAWPKSWDDLRSAYDTADKGNVSTERDGTTIVEFRPRDSIEELQKRVEIDWNADPTALVNTDFSDQGPPFRVIGLKSGKDTHYAGREPNTMVLEYLKWKANAATGADEMPRNDVPTAGSLPHPQTRNSAGQIPSIVSEIPPPTGFSRMPLPESSFGTWLRAVPLRTEQTEVLLFDGSPKRNQSAHFAILDIDVGPRDLQQCADAVIRLRAEYLFSSECPDAIQFNFTSGDTARWSDWRDGMRPRIAGNQVTWNRTAAPDAGYDNFRDYLDSVFTYAGSASLERELSPVPDLTRPEIGDVYIQGGFPGHAVITVDVAENAQGLRVFRL
ncbi:MAG: hypothetical protein KJ060_07655, partial [Candidatus Hydrogenedentes bacterium]|nr:hypothetical protein [Candidatus Hydrogenedentota bacterium]